MATHPTALGKIAVPTPGTAVQLSPATLPCAKIRIEAAPANAHTAWVGTAGLVGSTLTKAIHQFQIPAAGSPADAIEFESQEGKNTLDLSDYWIDANTATEGALVTYWTA